MYIQFMYIQCVMLRKNPKQKRERWPADQEEKVKKVFRKSIAELTVPSKAVLLESVHQFDHCHGDYRKLAFKINNLITSKKGRYTKGT